MQIYFSSIPLRAPRYIPRLHGSRQTETCKYLLAYVQLISPTESKLLLSSSWKAAWTWCWHDTICPRMRVGTCRGEGRRRRGRKTRIKFGFFVCWIFLLRGYYYWYNYVHTSVRTSSTSGSRRYALQRSGDDSTFYTQDEKSWLLGRRRRRLETPD